MIRAGTGQSTVGSTTQAAEQAAAAAMAQAGITKADAVFAFFTVEHAAKGDELLQTLMRYTGTDRIIGSSAAGVIAGEAETEVSHGLAVMALASDQMRAESFLHHPLRERDAEIGAEMARQSASTTDESPLLVVIPDTYNGQPQVMLEQIQENGFVPIVGAGSSENGTVRATYQACGSELTSNAVVGMRLSGKFEASVDITQGCQPITGPMVITKAQENLIIEIDNRPALEVFARILKGPLAEDLRRALMVLFVGLPADRAENSVAPGHYVVRNITGLDPKHGVIAVAEHVSEGEAVIFTLRDGERARDDLNQMLERQRERLGGKKPAFGLYFNCCARGTSLYGISGIDAAYIRQSLGEFPLIGMFGGYELAPLGNANHLFAYTGVLALITE
jgi:small ligand-binding sensory domain FIST